MQETIEKIVHFLDEKKATDIEVFDLSDRDYVARAVILANSLGGKHTSALYDYLRVEVKKYGLQVIAADDSDDWIAIDLGEILIHLMTPEYRMRYSLEEFLREIKEGSHQEDTLQI